jgi:hypothetical protein
METQHTATATPRKLWSTLWLRVFGLTFLWLIVVEVVLIVIDESLAHGRWNLPEYAGGAFIPILLLTLTKVTKQYQREHKDWFTQQVETIKRSVSDPKPSQSVIVECPYGIWLCLASPFFVLSGLVFFAGVHHIGIGAFPASRYLAVIGLVIAGLGLIPIARFIARLDGNGIASWHNGSIYREVAWDRIASCDIETGTFGGTDRSSTTYRLRDAAGNSLLIFGLMFVSQDKRIAFDRSLRAAFEPAESPNPTAQPLA